MKSLIQKLTLTEGVKRLRLEVEKLGNQTTPTILGIAGGSASGKSHMSEILSDTLDIKILHMDDYYLGLQDLSEMNFDHPASIDMKLLNQHIQELALWKTINKPTYDFSTHSRTGFEDFEPSNIIVVDGLYAISHHINQGLAIKVFIDAPVETRFNRRIKRDVEERGRTVVGATKQWNDTVQPMYEQYIVKQMNSADIVIDNDKEG